MATERVYHSESQNISNLSSYLAVGRELTRWLTPNVPPAESPGRTAHSYYPLANPQVAFVPHFGLSQQIVFTMVSLPCCAAPASGPASVSLGWTIRSCISRSSP